MSKALPNYGSAGGARVRDAALIDGTNVDRWEGVLRRSIFSRPVSTSRAVPRASAQDTRPIGYGGKDPEDRQAPSSGDPADAANGDASEVATSVGEIERAANALPIVAGLLLVGALWWAQILLIPVVLSVLTAYALEPVVARLVSWHVRRSLAVPIVILAVVAGLGLTAYGLSGEAAAFVNRVPPALHTLSQAIRGASRGAPGTVAKMQAAAHELETATKDAAKVPNDGATPVRVEEPTFRWSTWIWSGSRSLAFFALQMGSVLFLTYYLLGAGDLYRRKFVRMVPTFSDKKVTVQILDDMDAQIERFLIARVALSLMIGAGTWLAFRLAGLDNAGVWGVLSAVLFTVPVVGPTVLIGAATLAAFVQFGTLGMVAVIFGIGIAIAAIEANVLTPWLMSRAGRMSAVAVFVSLMFWGWIWGIWGLLLAVPITAALKSVCERMPQFAGFAELLKE